MLTIIAATDYSPIAENAVAYAAAMAKQCRARLLLYNAFKLSLHASNTILPASSVTELEQDNNDRLRNEAMHIAEVYEITVAHETSYDCIADGLDVQVSKYKAALVVLGMAQGSLQQHILGNTTTAALAKTDFPILAVPADARFQGLKHILFACDRDDHARSAEVFSKIKARLGIFDLPTSVEIFHVDHKINAYQNFLENVTQENETPSYLFKDIQSDTIIQAIKKEIIAARAELLIMVPGKYGFWSSLIHRSKTKLMASGLHIPLLAVPA